MYRFVLIFFLCSVLMACNNDDAANDPLSMPPYDKITDSIRKAPNDADLYFRRGSLLYSNNQPVFAEKDFRKSWQLSPKEEYAVGLTAVLKQKNQDSAIVFLQEALQKLPGNVFLQVALARGYQAKNENEKALGICNKIIQQYPNAIDAYDLKSDILKKQNRNAESLTTLQQAYGYAPGDVNLVHTLAFDLAEAGNPQVLALADSLIKADTENNHAEPYFFKGVYYSNTGNNKEAIRQFDAAIARNFNYGPAYINKGIIYYDQKNYEQAYKTFKLANTVSPREADPYLWMARTQEAVGNKSEAKTNYLRAYNLDKDLTQAKEAADRL